VRTYIYKVKEAQTEVIITRITVDLIHMNKEKTINNVYRQT